MDKVVVGMSGGVDSAVAALLLKRAGHEVIGLSMRLFTCDRVGRGSCCSEEDRRDARAVCEHIGISYLIVDLSSPFRKEVVEPFISSYLKGETPSPCILCNEHLKFARLSQEARRLGADCIATGHYARVGSCVDGRMVLRRGVDRGKDQSYFLFPALKGHLNCLHFPLGGMTKDEVRAIARDNSLPVFEKEESQEICFVPGGDYIAYIEETCPEDLPGRGDFVNASGEVLGKHAGFHAYTVGQRRGLGIGFGKRTYVVGVDAANNRVILGGDDELYSREMVVRDVVWAEGLDSTERALVQIRSRHDAQPASVRPSGDGTARVIFDEPQRAIAPGQAAVFYDGDEVIGGGWIVR
jgi:tRNA-specific 2-thiouridylase